MYRDGSMLVPMTKTRALRILRANLAEAIAQGDHERAAMVRARMAEWART